MNNVDNSPSSDSAPTPIEAVAESKPLVQKLKKKSELENNLLSAIEEHGE
jgi:hypothetical protein